MRRLRFQKCTSNPVTFWKCLTLLLVAGAVLCHSTASAETPFSPPSVQAYYLSPEDVASKSVAVVHVTIVAVSPVIVGNRVYSDVEGHVHRVWKGPVEGPRIVIRQLGGRLGQMVTVAGPSPAFAEGQDWILCLARPPQGWWTLYGLKHGAFQLLDDTAVRDYSGFNFVGPHPATVSNHLERIPIKELHRILASFSDIPDDGESPDAPPIKGEAPSKTDKKRVSKAVAEKGNRAKDSSGDALSALSSGAKAGEGVGFLYIALVPVVPLLGFIIRRRIRGGRRG